MTGSVPAPEMACGNGGGRNTGPVRVQGPATARRGWVAADPEAHGAGDRGVDRRAAAARRVPAAFGAEAGLNSVTRAIQLRMADRAGAKRGRRTLRAAATASARGRQADRLRRARQAALSARIRAVRRWPGRLPGHFPVSRCVLPEERAHARGRGRPGARDRLFSRLLHRHGRQSRARSCLPVPTPSPDFGYRRAGCRATGASASHGPPFSARPISARWASWARSGCRPAAWR